MPPAFAFEEMSGFQQELFVPYLTRDVRPISEHDFGCEDQDVIRLTVDGDFGGNKNSADPCTLRN